MKTPPPLLGNGQWRHVRHPSLAQVRFERSSRRPEIGIAGMRQRGLERLVFTLERNLVLRNGSVWVDPQRISMTDRPRTEGVPMCDLHDHLSGDELADDQYVLDTPVVRTLVATVQEEVAQHTSAADACAALQPVFEELLARRDWLPEEFQQDVPESGMGGGIRAVAPYRAADRSLCLFSLVVPPGEMTPIHDHLAWGLIGLYPGTQDSVLPPGRRDDGALPAAAPAARRPLRTAAAGSTTSTASARPPMSRRSRSTCSRTTRARRSATRSTRTRARRSRSARATPTRRARNR